MSPDAPLVRFARQEPAYLLAGYLRKQDIETEVSQQGGEMPYVLCLIQLDQKEQALAITEGFLCQPHDPKYQQTAWEQDTAVKLSQPSSMSENLPSWRDAMGVPFTSSVLLLCLAVFVLFELGAQQFLFSSLHFEPVGQLFDNQQWWRLLGPAFIHFSLMHIAFNLLWWWTLGGQIERILGIGVLSSVFFIIALISNYSQFLVNGPNFGGLSGVVYGVLGFVWIYGWKRPESGLSISTPIVGFMLIWLVLGYADLLWVSMANTAHTSGLLCGVGLGLLLSAKGGNKICRK